MSGLTVLAMISLALGFACAIWITTDICAGRRQRMWIMNLVWPLTALYSGPLGLWAYYRIGRMAATGKVHHAMQCEPNAASKKPFWQTTAVAATHCGAGCTLGDILAEWIMVAAPLTIFGHRIFGAWLVDYLIAFLIGIAFQYFTIVPMRHLSPGQGIIAALKADTLSLTAWQIGMYGWMAVATFVIFGRELPATDPIFWFMMQIAMLAGFLTSFPVNWWLIRAGLKEKM